MAKVKAFADNFLNDGICLCKVNNIVGKKEKMLMWEKGEIAAYKQFFLSPNCFKRSLPQGHYKTLNHLIKG